MAFLLKMVKGVLGAEWFTALGGNPHFGDNG
jgi:hypothetical protein